METDAKTQTETQTQRHPPAVLCRVKRSHIPKRQTVKSQKHGAKTLKNTAKQQLLQVRTCFFMMQTSFFEPKVAALCAKHNKENKIAITTEAKQP
jgi:hypothetical protein